MFLAGRKQEAEALMADVREDITNPATHIYAKM
jgi:hypothetical protein